MKHKKKALKDYNRQKKDIKNPFTKKKKRPKINWKKFFFSLLIISVLAGVFWWLFLSNFWDIKDIEVEGAERISEKEILDIAWNQTRQEKLLFSSQSKLTLFDKEKLEEKLKKKYRLPEVLVNKKIPNKIKILIKEDQCSFVLLEDEKYHEVDSRGYIMETWDEIKDIETPLIKNKSVESKVIGDRVYMDRNYLNYITEFYNLLSRVSQDIKIESFILDHDVPGLEGVEKNTITIKIVDGPNIYLDMKIDAESQVNRLIILKDKDLKESFWDKEYINLKFGDRIFYK